MTSIRNTKELFGRGSYRPFEDLAAYQKSWEAYMNPTPEMKASMEKMSAEGGSASGGKGYQEMYLTGSRGIYKVW